MKHNWKVTTILLVIFLLAQFIGIGVLYNYIDVEKSKEMGKTVFGDLPIGERPQMDEKFSFIAILIIVLVGTGILLLLIKYKVYFVWKIWFLLAVVLALTISWGSFIKPSYALFLALAFGFWKIFKPNVWVHNFTELFVYGGLAAIFAPLFNLWSVVILLLLISAYDMYAVWKSKHMIKLAKSQAKAKIFAGLLIPYKFKLKERIKKLKSKAKKLKTKRLKKTVSKKAKIVGKVRVAVLGGGDIGFPLIFTGVILKNFGLWQSLVIPFFSGAALLFLLLTSKEKKFYPAMPFISVGCFIGLGVVLLIGLL